MESSGRWHWRCELAVHVVLVDLGVKGIPHLPGRARNVNRQTGLVNPIDRETLPAQPGQDGFDIFLRRAELPTYLLGRQPMVITRGMGIMQRRDQFLDRVFLGGTAS